MRFVLSLMVVGAMACGTEGPSGDRASTIADLDGDVASGEAVYTANCAVCHLADGTGETNGGVGDDLVQALAEGDDDLEYIEVIINGEGEMTAFGDSLDDQEIADVIAYMNDAFGG
jgi:mono/diheme cytochrome c family protein